MFFLESLLSESFPSLESLSTSSPYNALQHCADLWTCYGEAQILIWSYSCVFLPPMSTAIRTSAFSFVGALSALLYISQTESAQLIVWIFSEVVGRLQVFFLSHPAPGFQLWFYFHLCMWVVHWGLHLRLPWRAWVCPCEGQVWRCCSCLGHRGSGSTRYSGELTVREAGNIVLQKGMATSIG